MHHQAFGIKRLGRFRCLLTVIQLGVDIVFDQRYLMATQQLHQFLFFRLGHGGAHGVLETGHAPAHLDRVTFQGLCEHAEVDAVARMHRDFHGFEFQSFENLQAGIERRGFDGHQVAGLGHGLQAQIQCFQCAVGDQQFFHGQHQPADHVAQGDLPTQLRVARRHVGHDHARVHRAAGTGQRPRQPLQWKQGRAGERRAEGHGVWVLDRIEDREHQFADIDFGRFVDLAADLRLGKRPRCMGIDEIAGARPGADQAAALKQVVGLEHRGGADAVGLAGVAYRWHALPGAENTGADQFSDVIGEFFVAFHRYPAMESNRMTVARALVP